MEASESHLSARTGSGLSAWVRSVPTALRSLLAGRMRRQRQQLGRPLTMSDGCVFVPFRETVKDQTEWRTDDKPAVLQPRFHLRGMSARRRFLHAIFRRVCILTTPFFVGIAGFRSKLWMVDPETATSPVSTSGTARTRRRSTRRDWRACFGCCQYADRSATSSFRTRPSTDT